MTEQEHRAKSGTGPAGTAWRRPRPLISRPVGSATTPGAGKVHVTVTSRTLVAVGEGD